MSAKMFISLLILITVIFLVLLVVLCGVILYIKRSKRGND